MSISSQPTHRISTLSWFVVVILGVLVMLGALGVPAAPVLLIGMIVAVLLAFRMIYGTLYVGVALSPFLGITVSVSTGALVFGERAFGGIIDISLAEVILFIVLLAWSLKLLLLWIHRRDEQWRPRAPLLWQYALIFFAHLSSVFSPLLPDPLLVIKYSFRPVLFNYLAFILLPVNLIRSRRRLVAVLGVITGIGCVAALNGLIAMFFPLSSGTFIGRAYPLPIFGVSALGENHNQLADLLVYTAPFTLALGMLVKTVRSRRCLYTAAAAQFIIGLFTFTRTFWIMAFFQILFVCMTIGRDWAKRHLSRLLVVAILLFPFGVGMIAYSLSTTARSSNSTRLMLTEIAYEVFRSSPWLGGGAGTFVDRIGSTLVFLLEYGDPLDSHGFIQKLAAEVGLVGLISVAVFFVSCVWLVRTQAARITHMQWKRAFFLLIAGAGGAVGYQLFNTDYWNGKMWLPIGILLAAASIFQETKSQFSPEEQRDILPS